MKPIVHAVGIDLGTTFSAIAVVEEDGQARAIPNAEGATITPSVAIWQQNMFLVGQPALDLVQQAEGAERERLAAALIRGVKRMIGSPPTGGLVSNGRRTSPIEISAAILAKLARDASARLGFSIHDAVITVPAHFGDRERHATKQAAELAGLRVLRIINEPSAAALTYSRGQQALVGTALVFDLGGGTFDATVLQLQAGKSRVLGTHGIEELGGVNFTNSLALHLQRSYKTQTKTPYPQDSTALDRLFNEAEKAKCVLSNAENTTAYLLSPTGDSIEVSVVRAQFERVIQPAIFQLQIAVELALELAGTVPTMVKRILLCGGSSRIPVIQAMLEEKFGRAPEKVLDLDLGVAQGAAYEAYHIAAQRKADFSGLQVLSAGLIVDCVSYPVGIAVLNSRGDNLTKLTILRSGEPLDRWSAPYHVRIVGAVTDFPPLRVYRGANPQLDEADYLGEIVLNLPPDLPSGSSATIRMLQDQNGMIQVQLYVKGQELPGEIRRAAIS
jgi:molecular chaperone DnaK